MTKETGIIMSGSHPVDILKGRKTMTRRVVSIRNIIQTEDTKTNHNLEITQKPETPKNEYWTFLLKWQVGGRDCTDLTTIRCPYGQVGDRLWVRETFMFKKGADAREYFVGTAMQAVLGEPPHYAYKATEPNFGGGMFKWRSSLFMPRKASRITLEITGIRVERVQEITAEDCIAEGVNGYLVSKFSYGKDYRVFRPYHKEAYPLIDHADVGDIVRFQGPNMGFASFITRNPKATGNLSINAKEAFDYIGSIEPDYILGYGILWDSINAKRGYGWEVNPWVWAISFKKV